MQFFKENCSFLSALHIILPVSLYNRQKEGHGRVGTTPASHVGGTKFKSRHGDPLSCFRDLSRCRHENDGTVP